MSYRAGEYTRILDVLLEEDEVLLTKCDGSIDAWWQGLRGSGADYRIAMRKLAVAVVHSEPNTELTKRLVQVCTAAYTAHKKHMRKA